jgi:hypothetical protein
MMLLPAECRTRSRLEEVLAHTPDPLTWAAATVRRRQTVVRVARAAAEARAWRNLRE